MMARNEPPLIVHVLHRLAMGGLENGLVNLINHLPRERFRHAVVTMTDATDFAQRITREDVRIVELRKAPGNSVGIQRKFFDVFRELRADVVHTRNLGALEAQIAAACARVPVRIHGEHGWDINDPDGIRRRYIVMRQLLSACFDERSEPRNLGFGNTAAHLVRIDPAAPCAWSYAGQI